MLRHLLHQRHFSLPFLYRTSSLCRQSSTTSTSTSLDKDFPVIDMRPILTPSHPLRASAITNIGVALRTRGFFYMSHVDVLTSDYIESVCVPFYFNDFAISDHPANISSPLLSSPLSLLSLAFLISNI